MKRNKKIETDFGNYFIDMEKEAQEEILLQLERLYNLEDKDERRLGNR